MIKRCLFVNDLIFDGLSFRKETPVSVCVETFFLMGLFLMGLFFNGPLSSDKQLSLNI